MNDKINSKEPLTIQVNNNVYPISNEGGTLYLHVSPGEKIAILGKNDLTGELLFKESDYIQNIIISPLGNIYVVFLDESWQEQLIEIKLNLESRTEGSTVSTLIQIPSNSRRTNELNTLQLTWRSLGRTKDKTMYQATGQWAKLDETTGKYNAIGLRTTIGPQDYTVDKNGNVTINADVSLDLTSIKSKDDASADDINN
jgi:hypothetical protein